MLIEETGCNGFFGEPISKLLEEKGYETIRIKSSYSSNVISIKYINSRDSWKNSFKNVNIIL